MRKTSNRTRLLFVAVVFLALVFVLGAPMPFTAGAAEPVASSEPQDSLNPWLELGVDESFSSIERNLAKDQIRAFIPPLLRGFTPLHAFVLPPKAFVVELSARGAKLSGDDFFLGGDRNHDVFGNFTVDRLFVDLGIFYGFDFGRKYLHGFTAFLKIPFQVSQTDGAINPNGIGLIDIMNRGSTQALSDISLTLKKKLFDQANFPVGLAAMAGITFPTGANDEKFGADGVVAVRGPAMPGPPQVDMPMDMMMMMGMPLEYGEFPFNNGVFNRFSDDGRLPSVLQPGDGTFAFSLGGALTRQFLPGDLPPFDRAAIHLGMLHLFRQEADGVDRGDVNTHQVTFVAPVWRDYLSLEVGYLGFYQFEDHYDGTFITPFFTDAAGNNVSKNATHVTFKEVARPSFARGEWGSIASSLILSPDPQTRLVLTTLIRVVKPDLGPAPSFVLRLGTEVLF